MTKLVWDEVGEHLYETGVDRCVFYPKTGAGVPWNGIVTIDENSTGGDIEELYFDGVKYASVSSSEDLQLTIAAFSSPPEFDLCDGTREILPGLSLTQQKRRSFGLCYRTLIGNDLDGDRHGYKLHLVYNAKTTPAKKSAQTLNDSFHLDSRSWTIDTVPLPSLTNKPTAQLVVNSLKVDPFILRELEDVLYGREGRDPRLPTQSEVVDFLGNKITEPLSEPV